MVILGRDESVVRRIGARLASFHPRVEAFTRYEDAYDFTKKSRNAAVVLLCDDFPASVYASMPAQLSRAYEGRGWPAFTFLIRTKPVFQEDGLRLWAEDDHVLAYLDEEAAVEPGSLWKRYQSGLEDRLIPQALRETLIALGGPGKREEQIFIERAAVILGGPDTGVDLNWFELTACRWAPLLRRLETEAPRALEAIPILTQLCSYANGFEKYESLDAVISARDESPVVRVSAAAAALATLGSLGVDRLKEEYSRIDRRGELREETRRIGSAGDPIKKRLFFGRRRFIEMAEAMHRPDSAKEVL